MASISLDTRDTVAAINNTSPYFLSKIPVAAAGGADIRSSGKEVLSRNDASGNYSYLDITTIDGKTSSLPIGPLTVINNEPSGRMLWEAMFRPDEQFEPDQIVKIQGS